MNSIKNSSFFSIHYKNYSNWQMRLTLSYHRKQSTARKFLTTFFIILTFFFLFYFFGQGLFRAKNKPITDNWALASNYSQKNNGT